LSIFDARVELLNKVNKKYQLVNKNRHLISIV